MKIINLKQGTQEWLDYRRQHIGASDVAAILGISAWKNAKQLFEEKVLGWDEPVNANMKRGMKMEEAARNHYQIMTGIIVEPMVLESTEYPVLCASFDGMTKSMDKAVEIKCGRASHRLAQMGIIPDYYICQLQHQMLVGELDSIDYFSFDGKEEILMLVERDDEFIEKMLEKETEFWDGVIKSQTRGVNYESVNVI